MTLAVSWPPFWYEFLIKFHPANCSGRNKSEKKNDKRFSCLAFKKYHSHVNPSLFQEDSPPSPTSEAVNGDEDKEANEANDNNNEEQTVTDTSTPSSRPDLLGGTEVAETPAENNLVQAENEKNMEKGSADASIKEDEAG